METQKLYVRKNSGAEYVYYTEEGKIVDRIEFSPHEMMGRDMTDLLEISKPLAKFFQTATSILGVEPVASDDNLTLYTFGLEKNVTIKPKEETVEEKKDAKKKGAKKEKDTKKKAATPKAAETPVNAKDKKKKAVEKITGKKGGKKASGVGAFVRESITAGKTFEATEKAVKAKFPDSKFNKAHWNWYKNNMK